jgi:iron complex transport system substrate-binding protein
MASAIPEDEKTTVYYAEGPDGLSTECDKSPHAELIELAGGRNIYQCAPKSDFGMERISIEQVMVANPEVILAQEKDFVANVYRDPRWQSIRAIKNRRVYLIPRSPFNWFDRPPSFMRLLGVKWLANLLYPERYPLDIARETREFYSLFLGVELDDKDLEEVLCRK